MKSRNLQYSFGPVPSRRLGRSLGINNIPPKTCSYSCAYCQVGRTTCMLADRRRFFRPRELFQDVKRRLARARNASQRVDYLTFVADGEPTLDVNLGREIVLMKSLGVPVAVITNGSLLARDDVREELSQADWVSVKIDTVEESLWREINRPDARLRLQKILDGMRGFAKDFGGTLTTETMLLREVNDNEQTIGGTAGFVRLLRPRTAYLSAPIRPPAEKWARAPTEEALVRAHRIFACEIGHVESLVGHEGDDFASSGSVEEDLLGTTAVHPMRAAAVRAHLSRFGASWKVVERLISRGELIATEYEGQTFYVRRFRDENRPAP